MKEMITLIAAIGLIGCGGGGGGYQAGNYGGGNGWQAGNALVYDPRIYSVPTAPTYNPAPGTELNPINVRLQPPHSGMINPW